LQCNTESIFFEILAAALISLSYLPQLQKAMPRNSTSDLSLRMLVALSAGLCLWIAYGVLRKRLGDHARQFDRRNALARRAWAKNSRLEVMTSQVPPNILFKRAAQKNLRQRGRRR
jgi:uncharacterized protein with PQ loop repeat